RVPARPGAGLQPARRIRSHNRALVLLFPLVASLAWCDTLENAKRAFDAGDYAAAARLFEKAHQETPRCEILFYLGMACYRLRKLDAAIIAFRRAADCDPTLIPAHLALGEAYVEKSNDGEALAAYARALAAEPNNVAALRGSASLYLRREDSEKAV